MPLTETREADKFEQVILSNEHFSLWLHHVIHCVLPNPQNTLHHKKQIKDEISRSFANPVIL